LDTSKALDTNPSQPPPLVEVYFHAANANLQPPPDLHRTVWRLMRFERFNQLIKHRALWFARFDEMEDKAECRVPRKNLQPSPEALIEAGSPPHMAHAANMVDLAGQTFFKRIEKEKPFNLINCWFLGEEPSDEIWAAYGSTPGSVAIRGLAIDVGEALSRAGGAEGFAYPVSYIDHEDAQLTMKHFLAPFFAKMRKFEFEAELRYLIHLGADAPKGAYVPAELARLIREVRVNCNKGFDPNAVQSLLEGAALQLTVVRAFPSKGTQSS
jgi:hypothetical protein